MKGFIYCISNDVNNKKYIGKTTLSIEARFKQHCCDAYKMTNERRPLYSAIRKYGEEHFYIELVEECELSLLEERECYWINKLETFLNGYNATLGGEGKLLYDYEKFIIDFNNGMLIKDIATKYKCDPHTVSKALRLMNIKGSQNHNLQTSTKVQQFTKDGILLNEFKSQREAARYLIQQGSQSSINTLTTNIGRVIKGVRKTCEGFIWKKKE